jgi:hypothetical protein
VACHLDSSPVSAREWLAVTLGPMLAVAMAVGLAILLADDAPQGVYAPTNVAPLGSRVEAE